MWNERRRMDALEARVKALEESLDQLRRAAISGQPAEAIPAAGRASESPRDAAAPAASVSDARRDEDAAARLAREKSATAARIQRALRDAEADSGEVPDVSRLFDYEVESGQKMEYHRDYLQSREELKEFIGKGLRITAYNGAGFDRVVIPEEIEGRPVVSIGTYAFAKATMSEIVLPQSIRAILAGAFDRCKNLKRIDLPDALAYLAPRCFADSGLVEFTPPSALTEIPDYCCSGCAHLERITLGERVTSIGIQAFSGCQELREAFLPESLRTVGDGAFAETSIQTMVFPSGVREVHSCIFHSLNPSASNKRKVTCVILGKDTVFKIYPSAGSFDNIGLVCCLPGSRIQWMAQRASIPTRPLSEFHMDA